MMEAAPNPSGAANADKACGRSRGVLRKMTHAIAAITKKGNA